MRHSSAPASVHYRVRMKMSRLIGALLCLLFLFASRCDSADQCEEDPNNKGCVCVFDKKSVDLRSLGHKDGTA